MRLKKKKGRYVDFVFCVEATSNMKPISEKLNEKMKWIVENFSEYFIYEYDCHIDQMRVKIILFRDFHCCPEPIAETKFFLIPDEIEEFNSFVDNIEYKGGYGYCNALEAITLAMQSDWTTVGYRRRHAIYVFSNGKVRKLGGSQRLVSKYPDNMPSDFQEFEYRWDRKPATSGKNITAFAPMIYPWVDMQVWNRYWHAISNAATDLEVTEIEGAFYFLIEI